MDKRLKVIGLALLLATAAHVEAQKKPARPADLPASLAFSCTSADFSDVLCPDDQYPSLTRVIGDSRNYPGVGAAETGEGAFLNGSSKELWLGMGAGMYRMLIDFNERADTPPCAAYGKCRLTADRFPDYKMLIDVENGEIQSNAVTGPGGTELPNGLLDLAIGEPGYARLKINFTDPVDGQLWAIRFNSFEYPGSNEIPVTRVDTCTWEFVSDGDDDNGDGVVEPLAGVPGAFDKRTKIRYDEGLFVLRFRMTLRVAALC